MPTQPSPDCSESLPQEEGGSSSLMASKEDRHLGVSLEAFECHTYLTSRKSTLERSNSFTPLQPCFTSVQGAIRSNLSFVFDAYVSQKLGLVKIPETRASQNSSSHKARPRYIAKNIAFFKPHLPRRAVLIRTEMSIVVRLMTVV